MRSVKIKERLLEVLFPPRCLVCRRVVSPGEKFCRDCSWKLPKEPFLRVFSLPGSGQTGFRTAAPLGYDGGFRKTIHRLKFRGKRGLAGPIGRLMAETAAHFREPFDCVAWVPMSKKKKRRRGYDQSELLARSAAETLGLPVFALLEKVRETKTQHKLSRREREKNVKGCYGVSKDFSESVPGKNILLIDDIVTTGATLRECASMLYRAGAGTVCGLCAADARREREE